MSRTIFPRVHVEVEILSRPAAPCTLLPAGAPGLVRINGGVYALCYLCERGRDGWQEVRGYRLVKGTGETYDVPEDLASCECKDRLTRNREDGHCKHLRALRMLREEGHIA